MFESIKSFFTTPAAPANPPPAVQKQGSEVVSIIKNDIKGYLLTPEAKVMNDPVRSLIYTTAIKVTSLFIALVFPFIGYTMIGMSLALIDRVILLNLSDFTSRVIHRINIDCVQKLIGTIVGNNQPENPVP
jgi:hypothetical protein